MAGSWAGVYGLETISVTRIGVWQSKFNLFDIQGGYKTLLSILLYFEDCRDGISLDWDNF